MSGDLRFPSFLGLVVLVFLVGLGLVTRMVLVTVVVLVIVIVLVTIVAPVTIMVFKAPYRSKEMSCLLMLLPRRTG